jgi:hypothetical protein
MGGRGPVGWTLVLGSALALAAPGCGGTSSTSSNSGGGKARTTPAMGMRLDNGDGSNGEKIGKSIAAAHADGVGLSLGWKDVEPNPPKGTKHNYEWAGSHFADVAKGLADAGVKILTVRVVGPPDWAVKGGSCKFKACPPTKAHYDDFTSFVKEAVRRYGPGGSANTDISHWGFWNEPNKQKEWGGLDSADGSYKQYSDLLARFYSAVKGAGKPISPRDVTVDAGEIAAGGGHGNNRPRGWVMNFNQYSRAHNRNDDYDVVSIHAYSAGPHDVVQKIRNYGKIFGDHAMAVTEFGWSLGRGSGPSRWKCVPDQATQASKLKRTVAAVRRDPKLDKVRWMIWFDGIDNNLKLSPTKKMPKCQSKNGYKRGVARFMNGFGLFRRAPDGTTGQLRPRRVMQVFRAEAEQGRKAN